MYIGHGYMSEFFLANELYTAQLLNNLHFVQYLPCIFFHFIVIRILTVILTLIYKIKRNYCIISGNKYNIFLSF